MGDCGAMQRRALLMPCALASRLKRRRHNMKKTSFLSLLMLLLAMAAAAGDWQPIAPGVDFQEFSDKSSDVFVTRVDMTNDAIRVVGTPEIDRGSKVSDYAARTHALAAINGDYFDDTFHPIGMTVGPCGEWDS